MSTQLQALGLRRTASVMAMGAVCLISALSGLAPAFAGLSDSLELEISADKEQFLLGEPIWIDVVLRNVSEDTLCISGRDIRPEHRNIDFFVTRGDEILRYTGGYATYVGKPLDLAPGEEVATHFDILEFYGMRVEETVGFEKLFHPGDYSVQARVWHSVTSNTLDVEVIEPSGEDAEIYRGLHEAALLRSRRQFRQAAETLYPLLASASQSAYRDKLYFWLIRIVHMDEPRKRALAEQVLEEYPDSRYARACLLRVLSGMDRAEAQKLVKELESTSPGTRAAVQGRKLLQTYEFRK